MTARSLELHWWLLATRFLQGATRAAVWASALAWRVGVGCADTFVGVAAFTLVLAASSTRLGWSSVEIAGTFLTAAGVSVVSRPIVGRLADRRGCWRRFVFCCWPASR